MVTGSPVATPWAVVTPACCNSRVETRLEEEPVGAVGVAVAAGVLPRTNAAIRAGIPERIAGAAEVARKDADRAVARGSAEDGEHASAHPAIHAAADDSLLRLRAAAGIQQLERHAGILEETQPVSPNAQGEVSHAPRWPDGDLHSVTRAGRA